MKHRNVLLTILLCGSLGIAAQENAPLWLRHPAISPDGKNIAFSYQGDIFTVPVAGGRANQLTTNEAYDAFPYWSPDGTRIAFASDREGSLDVFVIPAKGGSAKRLTTNSVNETPRGWLNDSTVIFTATIQPDMKASQGQFQPQTYTVSTNGKRPRMFKSIFMPAVDISKDGKVVYHDKKGFENEFRKHERSSGTSDIWVIDGDNFTKLTDFNGHDLNPVWTADGETIVFLSEQDGTLNVWSMSADGNNKKQLTTFNNHPVRNLSTSDNDLLAFAWNGEIYTLQPGKQPVKVDIEIIKDDYTSDWDKSVRTSGATNIAVSPDGDQMAFVLRGDVYVTSTKYKTTKRITNTPYQERCISFGKDGRSLVYDSDRDGQWKLYLATIDNEDEKTFPYSSRITETLLYAPADGKAAQQPVFSPDGKKVAFLEDRNEIRIIDVADKTVNTALEGKYNYSYSDGDIEFTWSPDNNWLLTSYIGVGGWNNQDIALVKADGTEVVDLTESGYTNYNPRWALDGKAVTYATTKYGMRSHGSWGEQGDVMVMFLDGEAWDDFRQTAEEAELAKEAKEKKDESKGDDDDDKKDKKKSKKKEETTEEDAPATLDFDLANRKYRVKRLTSASSNLGDYILSKDGDKLYYIASATEGGSNLLERDLKKGTTKVLVRGVRGGFVTDSKEENLYVLTMGAIKKVQLPDGKEDMVEFEARYDHHPAAERRYIYEHMLSQVRDKFYDADLHGVDWDMYGENYRRFLPYITNNYDFADLLSEILGELNASHTGGRYYAPGANMSTANLGAFFDYDYEGDGLKIAEVLPRGPLATKAASVKAGDIITAIDDVEIKPDTDVNFLLEDRTGKPLRLTVARSNGTNDEITVKPISQGELTDQLYHRWIERNAQVVDSLSEGRIGYVHVEGMDSPSFREVYSELLGKYRNCEAVIVDTRYNGGGWLHNDLAVLLSGKEYVRYAPRGRYIGSDPFNQWTKPSVMLVNESNYSDAHGSPYVYQTLGIGEVVGAPVPGTMTAVWWENQIDPSIIFGIPEVTSLDRSGKPLENQQLNPDVVVYNNPGQIINGVDEQLDVAVKTLLNKLDSNNK
ncbi:MAG: PD40 domain-containing protein [Muribaculaceae bacterium]|nr:PD40 domain-containing protein [Muribaculaceae bacterium]